MYKQNNIFAQRLTAVRQKLFDWQVDGVLITGPTNRRWLSGFTGSNAQLLVTAEKAIIATDFRYYQQAAAQAPLFTLFKHERTEADTAVFLQQANVCTMGREAKLMTLEEAEKVEKANQSISWVSLPETVEPLRALKTNAEIEAIRSAAAITDHAMAQVNQIARPGMTECELAWILEKTMREAGADSLAFPIIVASGSNGAFPHHGTGSRQLQPGDPIIIDMGAKLNGYHSDMTRTFFLGSQPDDEFWRIYNLVLEAQTAVLSQTRTGMANKTIDNIARSLIAETGHLDHFGHGLGHGVGLDIHENPFLSPRSPEAEVVASGMTITVEPGIYIPGWGGVRIEDLGFFTNTGIEQLSHCPKTPIIPIL
jgi:Xaa-Pro aminopeptidase